MDNEVKIISTAKELRKEMIDEAETSEKEGKYFKPIYVNVGALWDFEKKYKPKEIVSGTNDGFVFEYKKKLFGAVSTDRLITTKDGDEKFIYQLEEINTVAGSPYFDLGLEWINNKRHHVIEDINKYDKRFHIYPTFKESMDSAHAKKNKIEVYG